MASTLSGKYLLHRKIGEGSYGTVYIGVLKESNEQRAFKVFKKNGDRAKGARSSIDKDNSKAHLSPASEASILQTVNHPHIIKVFEYITTDEADLITSQEQPITSGKNIEVGRDVNIIVMEYAPHGDLLSFMNSRRERGFTEKVARNLFLQILSATRYLHDFGYIHCDIKLENILLFESPTNPILKLTDFGFAIPYSREKKMQYGRGSLCYASPEVILSKEFYGPEADIWSLGVVLFTMVCGMFPLDFANRRVGEAYRALEKYGLPFSSVSKELSPEYRELVMRMLDLRTERRITMDEIFDSDWINGRSSPKTLAMPMSPHFSLVPPSTSPQHHIKKVSSPRDTREANRLFDRVVNRHNTKISEAPRKSSSQPNFKLGSSS